MLNGNVQAVLATLAAELERVADVDAADLPALIGAAGTVHAALLARLVSSAAPVPAPKPSGTGPDRLLTVDEVAPGWAPAAAGSTDMRDLCRSRGSSAAAR